MKKIVGEYWPRVQVLLPQLFIEVYELNNKMEAQEKKIKAKERKLKVHESCVRKRYNLQKRENRKVEKKSS